MPERLPAGPLDCFLLSGDRGRRACLPESGEWHVARRFIPPIPPARTAGFTFSFSSSIGDGNTRTALLLDREPMPLTGIFIYGVIYHWRVDVALCRSNEHVYWLASLAVSLACTKKANWQEKKI